MVYVQLVKEENHMHYLCNQQKGEVEMFDNS